MRTARVFRSFEAALAVLVASVASLLVHGGCQGTALREGGKDLLGAIEKAPPSRRLPQKIERVYLILKENHSYDKHFPAFPTPGGDPPTREGKAEGRTVPLVEPTNERWNPGEN